MRLFMRRAAFLWILAVSSWAASHTAEGRRLQSLGRYVEAREEFLAAWRDEESAAPESARAATTLDDLASVHEDLGQFTQAERYCRKALLILEKSLGAEHPSVAAVLAHLGGIYIQMGQGSKAEPLLRRALEIRWQHGHASPLEQAEILNEGAILDVVQGNKLGAEALLHRALALFEQELGPEHERVASALSSLACLALDSARDREAAAYAERAWKILGKIPQAPAPPMVKSLTVLGLVYARTERVLEAEWHIKRALQIAETSLGPESLITAGVLGDYATVLRKLKRKREAETLEKRAAEILTVNAHRHGFGLTVDAKALRPR